MSVDREVFESLYRDDPDPWNLASRFSETRKRALTVAMLRRPRYARAYEPGCGNGLLTALLAPRCDELLAADTVEAAVVATRAAVPDPHVTVARHHLPADWPPGGFDLVVLSEIGYWLGPRDLDRLGRSVAASLEPGGEVVLCHWDPVIEGAPSTGAQAHRHLLAAADLTVTARLSDEHFTLELATAARGVGGAD